MRYESLVLGVAVLAFGIYLVSSHGYLGGTYLPGLIGLPAPDSSGGNTTFVPGIGGYSVGTVVALSGLSLLANGLRSPGSSGPRLTATSSANMPPELLAAIRQSTANKSGVDGVAPTAGPGSGIREGIAYCPKCGSANRQDARFCPQCGAPAPTSSP